MHDVVLYPQNGDRIVTTDSVTSLHPVYCNSQSVQRYLVPYDRVSCTYGLLRNVRMAPLLGVTRRVSRTCYKGRCRAATARWAARRAAALRRTRRDPTSDGNRTTTTHTRTHTHAFTPPRARYGRYL